MVNTPIEQVAIWYDPLHTEHDPGSGLPERPSRIKACIDALQTVGHNVSPRQPQPASLEELSLTHTPEYLEYLARLCDQGGGDLDGDTKVGERSFEVARRAAGMCIEGVTRACNGEGATMCLVRPPGHHASSDRGMGFCLVNNVAIAAKIAMERGLARRVMIVDFDVHHGNGTQDIFWTDPDVLYLSLHQWPWYPWTRGSLGEIGEGLGEGSTVNVPLPAMTGDAVYLEAFEWIVGPVLEQFEPDLLLVSCGFDAHSDDALSLQDVTSQGFGFMTASLMRTARRVCGERVLVVLEGGYHLGALGDSVVETVRALQPSPGLSEVGTLSEGFPYSQHALSKVMEFHGRRWMLGGQ